MERPALLTLFLRNVAHKAMCAGRAFLGLNTDLLRSGRESQINVTRWPAGRVHGAGRGRDREIDLVQPDVTWNETHPIGRDIDRRHRVPGVAER